MYTSSFQHAPKPPEACRVDQFHYTEKKKHKTKDISLVLVKCCFSLLLVTLIFTNKACVSVFKHFIMINNNKNISYI